MSIHITNPLRAASVIRVTGAGTETVNLSQLSANTQLEVITSASIKRVIWSSNGSIEIARSANTVLQLYGSGEMRYSEITHAISEGAKDPITITINSGGTIFLEITKDSQYTSDLVGY